MAVFQFSLPSIILMAFHFHYSQGTGLGIPFIQDYSMTFTVGERIALSSFQFPRCCEKLTLYIFNCTDSCGLKITFIDMDLPVAATIHVNAAGEGKPRILETAEVSPDGAWSRPSVVNEDPQTSILIHVYNRTFYPRYAGATFTVEAFNTTSSPVIDTIPDYTLPLGCGSVHSTRSWKGGEVKVKHPSSVGPPYPMLNCVWVLKKPEHASENVNVFYRIIRVSNLTSGRLAVRNGTISVAPILFHADSEQDASLATPDMVDFTSPVGLFINLRKPIQLGSLAFVYGLFTQDSTESNDGNCQMDDQVTGFFCAQSQWCIPIADRCDDVSQCPDGEDELNCQDYVRPTDTTLSSEMGPTPTTAKRYVRPTYTTLSSEMGPTPTTAKPCPPKKRRCPDGSCIDKYGIHDICTNENCSDIVPNRCGNQCYSDNRRCNGYASCENGEDEEGCLAERVKALPWWIFGVFIAIFCVLGAGACWYRRRAARRLYLQEPIPISESSLPVADNPPIYSQALLANNAPKADQTGPPAYDDLDAMNEEMKNRPTPV